jgi:hypothetical protein
MRGIIIMQLPKPAAPKAKKPAGYIIYRGASMLDGAPIVVVALTNSTNVKTGNMVQTYILVDNGRSPVDNARELLDSSICGDCKHRRGLGGACYVNLGQGARAVAAAIVAGNYPADILAAQNAAAGRMVRLGTYGDPAAVPANIWRTLLAKAGGHTGYSHQWQSGKAGADIMALCMASADNAAERAAAKAAGYRTFRVRAANEAMAAGEFICPASEEAGRRKLCGECGACDGGINSRRADPVIIVHGSIKNRFIPIQSI